MTVEQNLIYALEKGQDTAIVEELLTMVELLELRNRKPESLSGGQRQRVALARALVRKPAILMLDEPLSSLDVAMRSKLQDYILKVHKSYNLTTILISHDLGEIIKMADKVLVLQEGKISRQGNPLEVFSKKHLSGKFQFIGEVIQIQKEEVIYIVTILIGANIVRVVAQESEIDKLEIGDKVIVASKAFNPVIQRIDGGLIE
jgi:molybdate transport system ATP-binding protein